MIQSKVKKTIADFSDALTEPSETRINLPEEVLDTEDYILIKTIMDLSTKYRSSSWIEDMSLTEMTSDLMTLQANQVTLMYRSGILSSFADSIDERLKIARSKVRMNIKAIRKDLEEDGNTVSVNLDDVKDMSYVKTENLWEHCQKAKEASDFIKSMYFSVKDHVFMLNNTIQRLSRIEIM